MKKITTYDPRIHGRRSIRVIGFNYTEAGFYFITICTQDRKRLFGRIRNNRMELNGLGRIMHTMWNKIGCIRYHANVDEFVIMPDHLHGIIQIIDGRGDVGARHCLAPTDHQRPYCPAGSIGAIIGSFKSASTKRINHYRNTPGVRVWQRNYWERILRDPGELWWYRNYIKDNSRNWKDNLPTPPSAAAKAAASAASGEPGSA